MFKFNFNSNPLTPVPKVTNVAVFGAASTLVFAGLKQKGIHIEPEMATSILTLGSFLTGYFSPRN